MNLDYSFINPFLLFFLGMISLYFSSEIIIDQSVLISNKFNVSIVTKKKLGHATQRNLCKRQFKNLLHQIVKELTINFNYGYLILVKDNALKKDCFLDLKKEMFTEFKKII